MRIPRLLALAQAGLIGMTLLQGCQKGPLPLTPVQGKVSYKGLPVTGGTIVFTPDGVKGEKSNKIAHAKIDADGGYQLTTGEAKGASPGLYRVSVVSLAHTNPPGAADRFKAPLSLLPDKYRDPELSELTCEVKARKNNILDFDLN